MKILVLKFGGSSVGTIERIKKIANIIISYKKKGYIRKRIFINLQNISAKIN